MVTIGLVGYGRWGSNVLRALSQLPVFKVAKVCDLRSDRVLQAMRDYPDIVATGVPADVLQDPAIDALVIATPASTHFELAWEAIRNGKHTFVEKPLTTDSKTAARLHAEVKRQGVVLLVDHIFLFAPPLLRLRRLVRRFSCGKIFCYESHRTNTTLTQTDVGVLWDLAVHDLAILDFLFAKHPLQVSATGYRHPLWRHEIGASMTLFFPDDLVAQVSVSALAPSKQRRICVNGSNGALVYDDLEPESRRLKEFVLDPDSLRLSEIKLAPEPVSGEPLVQALQHFACCIEGGRQALVGADQAVRIARVIEAAMESMGSCGQPIELELAGGY